MDHPRIDDDQTPERYVMGRLPEAERHRFEEHLLDCPRCQEALETVEAFRSGLKEVSTEAARAAPEPGRPAALPRPRFRPLVTFLAAACVPLAILSALFYAQARGARRELEGSRRTLEQAQGRQAELEGALRRERAEGARRDALLEAPLAAPAFVLNLTRGTPAGEPGNRVALPASPGWVTLLFDRPEAPGVRSYRVRISTADGRPIGDAAAQVTSGGMLAVSLHSGRLAAGDYALAVEGLAPGKTVPLTTYRFRVAQP